jgi:hypothetical protein
MSKEPKTAEPKAEPQSTGLPYPDQPATPEEMVKALDFPSINEPPRPKQAHTLASLDPTEAAIGDPDLTLTVTGTGFVEGAQIVFNGGPEPTEFVSDTELTTIVKPSTAGVAGSFPVTVAQQGYTVDPPLEFTFTEEAPASRGKKRRY